MDYANANWKFCNGFCVHFYSLTLFMELSQKHLLEKLMSKDGGNTPRTFIAVVINTINMISGLYSSLSNFGPISAWKALSFFYCLNVFFYRKKMLILVFYLNALTK